nr:type II toxin-antitoxin system HigB family toxin [Legionella jordanis]
MRVISKKKLRDFYSSNNLAEVPLTEWYYKMLDLNAFNLHELRQVFNSADAVYGYTIFNIGGNNYRLVTAVHYNTQICYVRQIWSHADYDKPANREKLKRGEI